MPEMVEVRCPDCRMLWDRKTPAPDPSTHQINCRCKQVIRYQVGVDGRVTVLSKTPKASGR